MVTGKPREPAGVFERMALGASTTFVSKIASTGIKFATQVVLCRLLGAEGFGLYALCIVVYQVGELLAGMGLETGAVRFVSIHVGSGDRHRLAGTLLASAILPCVAGLVVGGVVWLTASPLACHVFDKPDMVVALKIVAVALPFGATAG